MDQIIEHNLQRLTTTNLDKYIVEQQLIDFLKGKNLYNYFSLKMLCNMYTSNIEGRHGTIAWICSHCMHDHIKEDKDDSL